MSTKKTAKKEKAPEFPQPIPASNRPVALTTEDPATGATKPALAGAAVRVAGAPQSDEPRLQPRSDDSTAPFEADSASHAPVQVVDLDTTVQEGNLTDKQRETGVSVWLGNTGTLQFADGTSFHVSRNREFITDPKVIANLREAAKNTSNKIFFDEPTK